MVSGAALYTRCTRGTYHVGPASPHFLGSLSHALLFPVIQSNLLSHRCQHTLAQALENTDRAKLEER